MTMDSARTTKTCLSPAGSTTRAIVGLWTAIVSVALPTDAHASFLSPELEDKLATFIALFVLFVIPVVLIALFWMVHVLPEKIAHKRHHPQFEAIRTLCLLSLVFGGLLWPIAWIWAYSKPVFYKMAYGSDRHPDALGPDGHVYPGEAVPAPVDLGQRIARLETRGIPESDLEALRADVEALESKFAGEGAR
jgi:Protein of unknown function (DUF3302)